ncbi:hypothetical protein Btru_074800 [Bulinus truncatus]|nr:hypothetical protein Btru_074800 [Bulinus truncatus]
MSVTAESNFRALHTATLVMSLSRPLNPQFNRQCPEAYRMCSLNETFIMAKELRHLHSAASMFLGFLGALGNSISIFLAVKNQLYRNCTMLMILELCAANLLISVFILPLISASNFFDQWVFGETVCLGFAYIMYVVISAECLVLIQITISQYLAIIHNIKYQQCQLTIRLCLLMTLPWVAPMAIYTVPLVHAWDEFGYDPRRGYCTMLNFKEHRSFHSVVSIFFVCVISIVIIYCYSSIYFVHYKSQRRTLTSVGEAAARFRNQARNTQLIKMITVILINYVITYVPFMVISIADPCVKKTPLSLYTVVIYTAWSHTATNPVIYALMNTKINAVWKHFLSCDNRCTKRDVQEIPANLELSENSAVYS